MLTRCSPAPFSCPSKEGRLFVYAALIEGPGATGMVCRPMAEKALAALGVLPAR